MHSSWQSEPYTPQLRPPCRVAWHPADANLLASTSLDSTCVIFTPDGRLQHTLKHHCPLHGVAWNPHDHQVTPLQKPHRFPAGYAVMPASVPADLLQASFHWLLALHNLRCSSAEQTQLPAQHA